MNISMQNKNEGRLSIYERSVLRLQEREEKLKKLETKIMSEYTFAPDVSLSKIKSSRKVAPPKELKTPRSLLLLQKTIATPDCLVSPHVKLPCIGKKSARPYANHTLDRSSSKIPCKAKLATNHESPRPFPLAENIPAEVFVSLTSISVPPLTNAEDEQVDITAETSSDSMSRIPDNQSEQSEGTDSGSI